MLRLLMACSFGEEVLGIHYESQGRGLGLKKGVMASVEGLHRLDLLLGAQ